MEIQNIVKLELHIAFNQTNKLGQFESNPSSRFWVVSEKHSHEQKTRLSQHVGMCVPGHNINHIKK